MDLAAEVDAERGVLGERQRVVDQRSELQVRDARVGVFQHRGRDVGAGQQLVAVCALRHGRLEQDSRVMQRNDGVGEGEEFLQRGV